MQPQAEGPHGFGQEVAEVPPVAIIQKEVFSFIAPAGNVIPPARALNAKRARHAHLLHQSPGSWQ
jgi:hypothetical protein